MPSMQLSRMVWQEGKGAPSPEFRTNRMCMRWQDFDAMATERCVPAEVSDWLITLCSGQDIVCLLVMFNVLVRQTSVNEYTQASTH